MIKSKNNSTAVLIVFIVAMLCFCAFHTDTTAAATKPGKVTLKSVTTTTNAATIKWSKKRNVTGYQVYQSKNNSSNFKKIATVKGTSYTSKNLSSNTTYYYKVRAYKGKKYGKFSSVKKAKTLKESTPTQPTTPTTPTQPDNNEYAYVSSLASGTNSIIINNFDANDANAFRTKLETQQDFNVYFYLGNSIYKKGDYETVYYASGQKFAELSNLIMNNDSSPFKSYFLEDEWGSKTYTYFYPYPNYIYDVEWIFLWNCQYLCSM